MEEDAEQIMDEAQKWCKEKFDEEVGKREECDRVEREMYTRLNRDSQRLKRHMDAEYARHEAIMENQYKAMLKEQARLKSMQYLAEENF
jgi:hypothetical protein